MFHSVRVVEFQGLNPATQLVRAGEVSIKVHLYGFSLTDSEGSSHGAVTTLPSPELEGLWEM
jgi:hypothetical protein